MRRRDESPRRWDEFPFQPTRRFASLFPTRSPPSGRIREAETVVIIRNYASRARAPTPLRFNEFALALILAGSTQRRAEVTEGERGRKRESKGGPRRLNYFVQAYGITLCMTLPKVRARSGLAVSLISPRVPRLMRDPGRRARPSRLAVVTLIGPASAKFAARRSPMDQPGQIRGGDPHSSSPARGCTLGGRARDCKTDDLGALCSWHRKSPLFFYRTPLLYSVRIEEE